jgi:hypothetical protein
MFWRPQVVEGGLSCGSGISIAKLGPSSHPDCTGRCITGENELVCLRFLLVCMLRMTITVTSDVTDLKMHSDVDECLARSVSYLTGVCIFPRS